MQVRSPKEIMFPCFHYPAAPAPWEFVNQFWHSLRDAKAPQTQKVWPQWGMDGNGAEAGTHVLYWGIWGGRAMGDILGNLKL